MKKLISLFLLLFMFQHPAFSQNQHNIDSLGNELKQFETIKSKLAGDAPAMFDTTKAIILNQICREYYDTNPDKAMEYALQCLALSEQIGFKKGIGNIYGSMGIINENKEDYFQALDFFKKSLKIREEMLEEARHTGNPAEIRKIKETIASSYNNIENIYWYQGNYPEALKACFALLKIVEELGMKFNISDCYIKIGNIYSELFNYPEALKNYFVALKIAAEIGSEFSMINSYSNIGYTYGLMGKYPEALKNQFLALKICEEDGDKFSVATSRLSIGYTYKLQGNYPEALNIFFTALKIFKEIGDKPGVAGTCLQIGDVYTLQKKYRNATEYISKSLLLAKEIGSLDNIKECYSGLAAVDSAQGDYQRSLEHYKMYVGIRDSMFNKENLKKLVQSQMQYDFDKKESLTKAEQEKKNALALKELQKQKLVRNGFVGGFAVVLIFAGVFFTQRNKIKAGKKRSDELLLNILPSEVAEELKAKGSADAKHFDDVTVMFTDFKNFTSISENLSPAELVAEIHTCFKAFDHIMSKHNIEKIKTIGDSYMCAGGLPVANKTNAIDVVNAALEIRQFMKEHLLERQNEGKEPFEMRIGIHTGPVVAGIVGIKKFAYDIWGDTVNIASRMESSGEAGKVNISGSTHELVKGEFNCTHRGKIQAKNKGAIDMYFVESPDRKL